MNALVPTIKLVTYALERQAPKILTGVAAGTSIAACATTAVATWKTKDIVAEYDERASKLKELIENEPNELKVVEYEDELKKLRMLTAAEIACEYAVPSLILGGSVAAGIGSASIFSKRIGVMAASYASLAASYKAYRNRVAQQYGKDKEEDIYKGMVEKEIEYIDEKGKKHKKKVKTYENTPCSDFCVFWIQGNNPYSVDDPALDFNFLEASEEAITREINTNGYICADAAYKTVGITPPSVPLGGKAADYVGKIWHNFGKIKSQDRINAVIEKTTEQWNNGTWEMVLKKVNADKEDPRHFSEDETGWELYCESEIFNANRFSWGVSEELKHAFIAGETDGMVLLCPNLDGDIFTDGAFLTLKDEDVMLEERYWGERPYE